MEVTPLYRGICCTLIAVFSLLGVCSTAYVILFTILRRQSISSFFIICITRCSINMIALTVYFFYELPQAIKAQDSTPFIINAALIDLVLRIYNMMLYLSVLLAINRFVALYFWQHYNTIFKKHITMIPIVLIFLYSVFLFYRSVFTSDCQMYFNAEIIIWDLYPLLCDHADSAANVVFIWFFIVETINVIVFVRVIHYQYTRKIGIRAHDTAFKKNMTRFAQTVLQDLLFAIDITCLSRLGTLIDHYLWSFFCYSFTGLLVHSLDGVIIICFNEDMGQFLWLMIKPNKDQVSVISVGNSGS